MNTQEVITTVASKLNLTRVEAERTVEAVIDVFINGALEHGKVLFKGHKFVSRFLEARKCRNPRTGESIDVPNKTKVVYKGTPVVN